jgi:hypothetical protein
VAAEYQEHFGDHAYDDEGNYIGDNSSEGQAAWEEFYAVSEEGGAPVADGEQEYEYIEVDEVVPEGAETADTDDIVAVGVETSVDEVAEEVAEEAVEAVDADDEE